MHIIQEEYLDCQTGVGMGLNAGKGSPGLPDRGWPLYILSVVMVVVAGLFVLARVSTRLHKKQLGLDDYNIILALVRWNSPLEASP